MSIERKEALGRAILAAMQNAVSHGMTPDDAAHALLGFGVGVAMTHFGWTPDNVAAASKDLGTRIADGAGTSSLIVMPRWRG